MPLLFSTVPLSQLEPHTSIDNTKDISLLKMFYRIGKRLSIRRMFSTKHVSEKMVFIPSDMSESAVVDKSYTQTIQKTISDIIKR